MSSSKKFQEFLDNGQYSKHGLEKYEWIFGETFLSTGGLETTVNVLKHATLKPDSRVLDLGSGLGGHSFLIAEKFDAEVTGLDLSVNMIDIAREHLERRPHLKQKVTFEIKDYTKSDYPDNSFDLIYSRDSFLHIENKKELFSKIYKWLKPGGYLLFTDYVRGEDETKYTTEFKNYLIHRGYHMAKRSEYRELLDDAGFKEVQVKDWRAEFKAALMMELEKLQENKEEFLSNFTKEDYEDLEVGWISKVKRADEGHQSWVLGFGRK